jgi:hypothetical protein
LQSHNIIAPKLFRCLASMHAHSARTFYFTTSQERSLNFLHELLRAKLALDPNLHREHKESLFNLVFFPGNSILVIQLILYLRHAACECRHAVDKVIYL